MNGRRLKGFTLSEIVISIGILALVIVSVLAVFAKGLNAMKRGDFQAAAARFAESKIAQVELLFVKFPQYDRNVRGDIPDVITGNITEIKGSSPYSHSPVILWHNPPDAIHVEIEGNEDLEGTGYFEFKILIEDYDGPLYNYDIKKVTVTVSCPDPPVQIKISSLIAFGIQ